MRSLISVIMILGIGYSQGIQAHADHDKARFVDNSGEDIGDCNNRFRPCKTVTYAAQKANKGDSILVARGQYNLETEQDLLYFTGELVPVLGGFDKVDQFQGQNPDVYVTSVSGVPAEYAAQLSQQGFHVIRDTKSKTKLFTQRNGFAASQLQQMQNQQSNVACVDGQADGFACENISLLSHVPLSEFPTAPSSANDIWGHVDLNTDQEYAIIGLRNGIAVVDVTDPIAPVVVGSVSGISSAWRDVKVYQYYDTNTLRWQAYAYATTEAAEGLTIIDLNDLANGINVVRRQTTDSTAHNIYISNIDYGLNIALAHQQPAVHILGANNFGGAFRSYSLADPETLGATYSNSQATRAQDYTHDMSSLLVNDARAQTDCTQANDFGCLVMLDFNENELRLWDHTDANQAIELGSSSYPNAQYTHSGWHTEDKQFVIVHDELDEQRNGLNSTINIFDISSLTTPTLVGTWTGPTRAIDHNGFVRGNRYYMSNYERGITVLDITDPANPSEVGFFDTFPVADNTGFNGAWGIYPYLPSGHLLVSDINSGLYILQDNTLESEVASFNFSQQQFEVQEGNVVSLTVDRTGVSATSVGYEIIPGSANLQDFELTTGVLDWSINDSDAKSISISTHSDTEDEITESFFVRLFDPKNGATLSSPNITKVQINDALYTGQVVFNNDSIQVKEIDGEIQIPVTRQGGSDGAIQISYSFTPSTALLGSDANATNGTLEWPDGDTTDKFITLTVLDDLDAEELETLIVTLSADDPSILGAQATLNVQIRDDETNQAPTVSVADNFQVNGRQTVALSGSGTDPEGQAITYLWQQVSGGNVTITNASSDEASFTAPSNADTLEFSLTITDDFGLTATENITITVIAAVVEAPNNSSGGGGSAYWLLLLSSILFGYRRCNGQKISNQNQMLNK